MLLEVDEKLFGALLPAELLICELWPLLLLLDD